MGVIQVQNKFPAFRFAGESSKDYNVYITDVNVFDSAARDVQSVEIPGRNGAYILDHGRYKNVAVKYDCAIGAQGSTGAEDFAEAVAAVRSWLGSHVGYYRLEDDLNADEYRMGAFTGGIGVDTVGVQMGRFSVNFDCKPQRFLVDGDTAQTITSGGTIENPTAFNARPLLMVDGYGIIDIGGHEIVINDEPIGVLTAPNIAISGDTLSWPVQILDAANNGDPITVSEAHIAFTAKSNMDPGPAIVGVSAEQTSGDITVSATATITSLYTIRLRCDIGSIHFVKGTAKTETMVVFVTVALSAGQPITGNVTITYAYDGNKTVTVAFAPLSGFTEKSPEVGTGIISVNSSKGSLGEPLYFDLDLGEAYKYESGNVVSVNSAVSFGAELPELPPGETAITFDNTVSQLQVVPRWWRL